MKMTKLIREYITDEVSKKYQPLIDAAEEEYKSNSEKIVVSETQKELEDIAAKMWKERLAPYYAPKDLDAMIASTTLIGCPHKWGIYSIPEEQYSQKIKQLRSARDKTIKDILITMELGGSKADLDRMLASVVPSAE